MEVLGDYFDTMLVIRWGTDALRGTLKGPRMDFHGFLMDFGSPTLGVSPFPTNQALEFTLGDIIGMLIKFQSG